MINSSSRKNSTLFLKHEETIKNTTYSIKKTKILNNLIAGSIAGLVAESILHPLDTVSLRLKIQSPYPEIMKYTGFFNASSTILREGKWIIWICSSL